MNPKDDPSLASNGPALAADNEGAQAWLERDVGPLPPDASGLAGPSVGRLHGFDLMGRPIVSRLPALAGQLVPARSAVGLRRAMVGLDVVVLFEGGDVNLPIILGVLEPRPLPIGELVAEAPLDVEVDGERRVIEAEREIVLRCGEASITLTRAGKVIIRGSYIMSRSSGYNKIKGAAVDIN